jgi:hypothetical protein
MRVAELAKDLGYRAAELVEMVKDHAVAIPIANPRGDIDARSAAQIRAKLPHRRNLKGELADRYAKIVVDLAAQEAAKPEPKPKREKKAPVEGEEAAPKKSPRREGPTSGRAPPNPPRRARKRRRGRRRRRRRLEIQGRGLFQTARTTRPKSRSPRPRPRIGLSPGARSSRKPKSPDLSVDKVESGTRVGHPRGGSSGARPREAVQEDKSTATSWRAPSRAPPAGTPVGR